MGEPTFGGHRSRAGEFGLGGLALAPVRYHPELPSDAARGFCRLRGQYLGTSSIFAWLLHQDGAAFSSSWSSMPGSTLSPPHRWVQSLPTLMGVGITAVGLFLLRCLLHPQPPGPTAVAVPRAPHGYMVNLMEQVHIAPMERERLAAILPVDRVERLEAAAARGAGSSATGWCGTSTPPLMEAASPRCSRPCSPTARARGSRTGGWCWTAIRRSSRSRSGCTTRCTGTRGMAGPSASRSTSTTSPCSAPTSRTWWLGSHLVTSSFSTIPRPPDSPGACASWGLEWSGAATWDATCPTATPGRMGVPPALPRAGAGAGVLAAGVRAGVGRGGAAGRHPTVDRPLRRQEHATGSRRRRRCPGRSGARRGRRSAGTGRLRPARRHTRHGEGTSGLRWTPDRRPTAGRRTTGPPGEQVGPAQGHGGRDGGLRHSRSPTTTWTAPT